MSDGVRYTSTNENENQVKSRCSQRPIHSLTLCTPGYSPARASYRAFAGQRTVKFPVKSGQIQPRFIKAGQGWSNIKFFFDPKSVKKRSNFPFPTFERSSVPLSLAYLTLHHILYVLCLLSLSASGHKSGDVCRRHACSADFQSVVSQNCILRTLH